MMISLYSASIKLYPDKALVVLDISNAFGEISRKEILDEVIAEVSEMAPYFMMIWEMKSTLIQISTGNNI